MSLLITESRTVIDTGAIRRGDMIRAKYRAWKSAVNGVVANVDNDAIRVLYIGTGSCVTNYFTVTAAELDDGDWTISWSTDFTEIGVHPPEIAAEGAEETDE